MFDYKEYYPIDYPEYRSDPRTRLKGDPLLEFPENYAVIDLETTGLSPKSDEIIEMSALKIRNGQIVDSFTSLVKPAFEIDPFISELTGITNDMLKESPKLADVLDPFLAFVGRDIIVGHNINFDINFIYDRFLNLYGRRFNNNFCDLLYISRLLFPDFPNHKLGALAHQFHCEENDAHRALADCRATFNCFEYCRRYVDDHNIDLCDLRLVVKKTNSVKDLRKITTDNTTFDETHPLFNKVCVFTGTLESMTRAEAAQCVVDLGGICENSVTKRTDFLILGSYDYINARKYGKSRKHLYAEELIRKGVDIKIIPEDVFYDMLEDNKIGDAVSSDEKEVICKIFENIKKILNNDAFFKIINDNTSLDKYSVLSFKTTVLSIQILKKTKKIRILFPSVPLEINDPYIINSIKKIGDKYFFEILSDSEIFDFSELIYLLFDTYKLDVACCSHFEECSDAKCCINNDPEVALHCFYRHNLRNSKIFYGKNRNV